MRATFKELFVSSAIIQGLMALGSVGAIIYMAIIGQPIPEVLVAIAMGIVGYYFGTKTQQRINGG